MSSSGFSDDEIRQMMKVIFGDEGKVAQDANAGTGAMAGSNSGSAPSLGSNQPDGSYYRPFDIGAAGDLGNTGGKFSFGDQGGSGLAAQNLPPMVGLLGDALLPKPVTLQNTGLPTDSGTTFSSQNPYVAAPDLSKGEGIQPFGLNRPGYTPQDGDRELLARVIFSEGAGVSGDYPALAWAIINRVGARGFPSTLQGVINQTDSKGRPELGINTPLWSSSALPDSLTGLNALSYQKALSVADGVLNGTIRDPTQGARYIYSGAMLSKGFFPNAISSGRLVPSAYPGTAFTFYRDTQN